MIKKTIKNRIPVFSRYATVGAIATLTDLGFLYVFVDLAQLDVLIAATFSFLIANIISFVLNKFWTFKSKSRNYRKLYIKFFTVSLVGLALTVVFMHLLANIFEIWHMLAKIITSLVVVIWNFLANKLWTFRDNTTSPEILKKFPYDFSIIIPAYNEENRIKSTLLIIEDFIKSKKISAEILVISDGSTDKTNKVVAEYTDKIENLALLTYEKNQGKGFAVKTGIQNSRGAYLLFADADNSTPIEELPKLKKAMEESHAQIAIGSRYLKGSNVRIKQSRFRILIGRTGNFLIRLFLIDGISDTQCGFKLFTHRAAKEIFTLQKVKRFGFDMEALVIAKSLGYKVTEVPVSWFNSTESRVRPIKDALHTLKDLVYIKLNLWAGRYSEKDL